MAVFLIFLYLVWITPVRFGAALLLGGSGKAKGAAAVMLWGVRVQAGFSLRRDQDGRLLVVSDFHGREKEAPAHSPQSLMTLLKALKRANISRRLLRNGIRLTELSVQADVGGMDAASIALGTAALRALGALLPALRITAKPAFQGSFLLRARCIAQTRLGTIMTAGALGAWSLMRSGKKEEKLWNIPSET